ncbi:TetR/AcrR family transcriptional regulator [Terrihabitans sp. B22-R8]|uniref:TetR/AcrR family transcriptional regulator n=1 Tax=Terrihabitans sp. B22-R8 TaxID=3425128 RepID=UPI00403D4805
MARVIAERSDVIPKLGEVFREHGFEGASLSVISAATGLGKGSLYHFFPGGKREMAEAVLDDIDTWFENEVFRPLREDADPAAAVRHMMAAVEAYFRSGNRVCLVGAFALNDVRDSFARRILDYFAAWQHALADALRRVGHASGPAGDLAEDVIAAIQGGLVTARALGDPAVFVRTLRRCETRMGL